MGAKRKVDAKLYTKVKKELKAPKDDKKVMKKYKLGQTTVRAIRNSWCYDDFLARTTTNKIKKTYSPQEQAQRAWMGFMIVCGLGALAVVFLFFRWLISLIFGV